MITDGCVTFVNLLFFICICLAQHVLIKKMMIGLKGVWLMKWRALNLQALLRKIGRSLNEIQNV